jgi:hypothetical protein
MMRLKKQLGDHRRKYSHVVNMKTDKFGNGTATSNNGKMTPMPI